MPFEQIYSSTWHQPVSFWVAGAPLFVVLSLRLARLRASRAPDLFLLVALWLAQIEIACDAGLTSSWTPLTGRAATTAIITFVILGDFRFFVLLGRYARARPSILHWLALPAAAAFVVPVSAHAIAPTFWPENTRALFLTYELLFSAMALLVRLGFVPRLPSSNSSRWLARLTSYELAQYGLWATADVLILLGHDVGFAVRLVPNTMYYVGFVAFAYLTAPKELRP